MPSATCDPIKPAPPVTSTFIAIYSKRRCRLHAEPFKQMRARLRARCCLHLDLAMRRNQRLVEEFEVGGNPTPEPANTRLHPDLGMPPHEALRFLNVADVARLIARTPLGKPHRELFAIQFDENLAKLVPYGQRVIRPAADV